MKHILLYLFLFSFSLGIKAQIVKGKVSDSQKQEIPFAKVRVQNTGYGTVANAIGNYQIELKKGIHILVFSAPGFESKVDTVEVIDLFTELPVTLDEAVQEINEVVVTYQSKKERGKEIMKQVIDKRSYFQDLLSEYTCDTYCFSSLEKDKLDSIKKDSIIGKEKLNLIEWRAKTSFKKPTRFKDEFYAYNDFTDPYKSINTSSASFSVEGGEESLAPTASQESNPYLFVTSIRDAHFSIFDNAIDAPKLTQNPIISPMAFNAFFYYNFYLEKSFLDSNEKFVYEITVKPKFDYEALFEGTLYIRDSTWEIVSYDLGINPKVLLFFKEIRIICDYKKVGEHLVPTRKEFIYDIKEGKNIINGLIRVMHESYTFKVDDSPKRFWLETSVYQEDAFDKDSSYWNSNRPFTLKDIERQFIHEQDSIINYHESDEYLRKMDSIRNKISILNVIFGGIGHVNSFKKYEISINGLISQVIPFGVGGYRHRLQVHYKKEFKNGQYITIDPDIDYGFLNKDVKGSFGGSYMYNPMNFSKIGFKVGDIYDFVSNTQNIQSTLSPSNRVRNKKAEINYSMEIFNGMYMRSSLLFSDRQSIDSLKYPSWVEVFGKFQTPQSFNPYRILLLDFEFEYHFRQKYIIRKKKKIVLGSPWPVLTFHYKKGLPNIFAAQANFDFVELKIHDEIKLNSFGNAEVKFVAGGFVHKKDLRIIEHKFFRPSDQFFFSNPVNSLQLLDTALNTSNSYMQLNFIHHFNGFFLNKIWLINRLKLEETIGGSMLMIPDANFFQAELYAGLERKFRIRKSIFKVGIYAVSQANTLSKSSLNFKIGFNPYNAFADKWDY